MNDILLKLSANPGARKAIKALGLPIPTPQILARAQGPWRGDELSGQVVWLHAPQENPVAGALRAALAAAGARILSERPPEGEAAAAVVIDASAARSTAELRALYDVGHPAVPSLAPCGRVLVIGGLAGGQETAAAAAAQGALEGFVRSLAKEVGRRGSTAQLLRVTPGSEGNLAGPLAFFLSSRSAYVTGQPLVVGGGGAGGPERWAQPLDQKIALVTGGGRGIGLETARRLAGEGARVLVVERPADAGLAEEIAGEIGGRALAVDVASPSAPEALAEAIAEEGGLDILVHNAGITRDKTLAKMDADHWDQVMAVNLQAVVGITDHLLAAGLIKGGGRIVGLASIAGIAGNAGQTNYGATKAAVIAWARHLAGILGARGITANAIAPGFIETRLTEAMPFAIREIARRMNSLGQGGQPADVAEAITFLCLPSSRGVTGQVLRVCGGSLVGA